MLRRVRDLHFGSDTSATARSLSSLRLHGPFLHRLTTRRCLHLSNVRFASLSSLFRLIASVDGLREVGLFDVAWGNTDGTALWETPPSCRTPFGRLEAADAFGCTDNMAGA